MRVIVLALLLSGCSTTTARMAASPPFKVVHSRQDRAKIADCLLNRVTSEDVIATRTEAQSSTTLAFNGSMGMVRKPALYHFVIRDEPTGSEIEVRRYAGSNLSAAETCF